MRWILATSALVLLGTLARASQFSYFSFPLAPRELRPDALPLPEDAQPFCFDPQAAVLLTTGPDLAPGRAGEDDDLNGIVDDRAEMGAVPSDDQCIAPADPGYRDAAKQPQSMTVSRGAFVPCNDNAQRWLTTNGWRIGELQATE